MMAARPLPQWTRPLAAWYRTDGRHDLPWRLTKDPWAILVSELMLQQTPVVRVLPKWTAFLEQWPTPDSCAAASLDDVLRLWQGLGYPRRARALHSCAQHVASAGWPQTEVDLCLLPGIGPYTAKALLTFAFDQPGLPPRDTNLARVAARAALGVEAHEARPRDLDELLVAARPRSMSWRDYAYALFDVGAVVCGARSPHCTDCPLASGCQSRERLAESAPTPSPHRQAPYHGSLRQLRGAILAFSLEASPPLSIETLREQVDHIPAMERVGAFSTALRGLVADGLLPATLADQLGDNSTATTPPNVAP